MREKLNTEFVGKLPRRNVDIYDTKFPGWCCGVGRRGHTPTESATVAGSGSTLGRADVVTPDHSRVKARDELNKIDKGHDQKARRGERCLRNELLPMCPEWTCE